MRLLEEPGHSFVPLNPHGDGDSQWMVILWTVLWCCPCKASLGSVGFCATPEGSATARRCFAQRFHPCPCLLLGLPVPWPHCLCLGDRKDLRAAPPRCLPTAGFPSPTWLINPAQMSHLAATHLPCSMARLGRGQRGWAAVGRGSSPPSPRSDTCWGRAGRKAPWLLLCLPRMRWLSQSPAVLPVLKTGLLNQHLGPNQKNTSFFFFSPFFFLSPVRCFPQIKKSERSCFWGQSERFWGFTITSGSGTSGKRMGKQELGLRPFGRSLARGRRAPSQKVGEARGALPATA